MNNGANVISQTVNDVIYRDIDVSQMKNLNESIENREIKVSEPSTKEDKKYSEKEIKAAVDKFNKLLEGKDTHVEYEPYDKLKGAVVLKIVDNNTKKVVKEIPPKKILDMVAKLCEMAGLIINEKA